MKKKINLEEISQTKELINQIINTLEDEYKVKRTNTLPLDEVFSLMQDFKALISNYIELDVNDATIIIKRHYVPLIKLLIKLDNDDNHKAEYLDMLEDAYRLGARNDFACFLLYYEWEEEDKLYEKRISILHPYVYYLNEMAHDPSFELIIANYPSGYGKTRLAKIYEAWRFGMQPYGTFLYLCSNDTVVKGGSRSVIDIIKNERYGRVFPHLSYQTYGKDLFLKETDGEWKLKDCKLLASYYASTVNTNVVGERANLSIHIDDLYGDYKEALDENLNSYYVNKHNLVWTKRYVQNKIPQIIITGTMWAPHDYIVQIIDQYKRENEFARHPKFKYTIISSDRKKVIIQVPALDPITDLSTCEELKSTKTLRMERKRMDRYLWECNFQQNPTTPEGLEFDWNKLKTYEIRPENIYKCAYAVIDGTRKSGKDFFAMPIFYDYVDETYALADCIFTKTATSELIDNIVDKIIEHHISKLVIETNVDGGLKHTLNEKLKAKGISYCTIIEKYNTVPKSVRIEAEKGTILRKIVFPSKNLLEGNTDINKYMQNITLYNSNGKNANDDAPDSAAMFCSEIVENRIRTAEIQTFQRFF